ncbi:immunoglobulin-like domain-containing protein [Gracilibacillus alcaliphilus]|uniref:immunoglobulin-like domain-containing protein n=1 Tax=Gracilibacillus alcaliphilus TaxID=1401441 RepID=UPI00195A1D61|nr:immunoglobulin-like domain-containing protein [Gracilibacillus alcaliphilus]MBM7675610.1 hypothetical protein [Gracilibacillus alcaliphilus]
MIDKNVRCSVSFLGKCFLILLLVCTSWLSSSGLSTVQVTWAADNSNQLKPKGFEDINLHTLVDIDQDNISSLEKPEHVGSFGSQSIELVQTDTPVEEGETALTEGAAPSTMNEDNDSDLPVVTDIILYPEYFSPNDDGTQDTTDIRFKINRHTEYFSLDVYDPDSSRWRGTIIESSNGLMPGSYIKRGWDGTVVLTGESSSSLDEGSYVVIPWHGVVNGIIHPIVNEASPFVVDVTAPVSTLDDPPLTVQEDEGVISGQVVSDLMIDVLGDHSAIGVAAIYEDNGEKQADGEIADDGSFTVQVPLQDGLNTFEIYVYDSAGNGILEPAHILEYTYKNPQPPQTVTAPDKAQQGGTSVQFSWEEPDSWGIGMQRSYVLQFFNGKSWYDPITNIETSTYEYTLPENIDTKEAKFRVKSVTEVGESTFTESNRFTIISTPPTIILHGDNPLEVSVNGQYEEPSATAKDAFENDLTNEIEISGEVETGQVGEYTITYTVQDEAGNEMQKTRQVNVINDIAPTITLSGQDSYKVEKGSTYTDPGATAEDYFGADVPVTNDSAEVVNMAEVGEYTVTYIAEDEYGNKASATRTVIVAPQRVAVMGGYENVSVNGAEENAELMLYQGVQEISSGTADTFGNYTFKNVSAGEGYYVTQTVHNFESFASQQVEVMGKVSPQPPQSVTTPSPLKGGRQMVQWEATTDWGSGSARHYVIQLYDGERQVLTEEVYPTEDDKENPPTTVALEIPIGLDTDKAEIRVQSVTDHGESVAALSGEFIIDNTMPGSPAIMLDAEGWTNAEAVVVSITAGEDHESGTARTEYRIEEGEWQIYEQAFSISEEGETVVYARTVDQAGNNSEITEATVQIKRTAPAEPSMEVETSAWTNAATVAVTMHKQDDTSFVEYQLHGTEEEWLAYAGNVVITEEGETTIYARAVDQAGNTSEVVENVVRIDRTAPELTLLGDNPISVRYGEIFADPGYLAEDNLTENLEVAITGEVDISQIGIYELTYSVQDAAGNETNRTRAVHVVDEEFPVITLNGDNPLIIEVGTAYEELGATAHDNADGDISDQMIITGQVDISKLGSYQVAYKVADSSGNQTEVMRTVEVVDTTNPEIILEGKAEITLELGDSYQESGAIAKDNYDGDISDQIKIIRDVNIEQVGTYELIYTVTDSSGNVTSGTRTVHIVDTTAPADLKLSALETTTNTITLVFSAFDLAGIKTYILFRDGEEIATIDGEAATYTDQTLQPGETYTYSLAAVDYSNNLSEEATLTVTTQQTEKVQVENIEKLTDLSVAYGTARKDLSLPDQVTIILTNKATLQVPVHWYASEPAYDPHLVGTYTFNGDITLPDDVLNPEAKQATVKVVVNPPKMVEIILDKPAELVYPGAFVQVKETNTTIQLPEDLPEGTTLQVKSVKDIQISGFVRTGELYDFIFTYPKGKEDYAGDFILTMGVEDEQEQAALYHYNGETQIWEYIGGEQIANQLTATVSYFSIYGVLAEEEENLPPEKPNGEKEESPEKPTKPKDEEEIEEKQMGTKEDPEGKQPTDTKKEPMNTNPMDSKKVATQGESTSKQHAADKQLEVEEEALPDTTTNMFNWLLFGTLALIFGVIVITIYRRKAGSEQ